ncbi:hypothetical protein Q1695_010796 [Nippostrongylus brasiliensis]|nr:hypothetical protein Q1695_010796 [Nippostrongylus brasiliensis]
MDHVCSRRSVELGGTGTDVCHGRCLARTVRNGSAVRCWDMVSFPVGDEEDDKTNMVFCKKHWDRFFVHSLCLYCKYFVKSGWIALCSLDLTHITHLRCAVRISGILRLACSHCGNFCVPSLLCGDIVDEVALNGSPVSIDMMRLQTSLSSVVDYFEGLLGRSTDIHKLYGTLFSALACDARLQQYFSDLLLMSSSRENKGLTILLMRFLLHCHMQLTEVWSNGTLLSLTVKNSEESAVWSNGTLLSLTVKNSEESAVRMLREAGCSIYPDHLRILRSSYSASMFDALLIESEYASCLLFEDLITDLIESESWSYLLRLLQHFNYKVADQKPSLLMNENALLEACKEAPDDVQHAMWRTSQMSRARLLTHGKKIIYPDLSNGSERFPVQVVNDADTAKAPEFSYTTRIVDRSGVLAARRNTVVTFCCCSGVCSTGCECSSGIYDEFGFAHEASLEWPFVECSAACTCSLQCGNRVAQKGATIPIEVFRTCDGRGWAVRALRNIRRGAFIGEYTGELLSDAETARPERTDTYFFETRVGERLYTVDARMYGNFTRFINHSCRPNATVGMVVWEAQLEQLSHICIFATENIPKGVEITISYGQSWWDAKLRLFSCRCGHSNCEYTEERRKAELLRLTSHLGVDAHTRSVSTVSSSSSDDSDEMRSV